MGRGWGMGWWRRGDGRSAVRILGSTIPCRYADRTQVEDYFSALWPRTKIKHLMDLGVSLKTAIQHGVSSKSYWQMAITPAVQQALSNAWLKAQGLGARNPRLPD